MARWSVDRSCIAVLALVLLTPLPGAAQGVLFGEGGYELHYDESRPASQVNVPPIFLTAGEDTFNGLAPGDIQLECSVFAGQKGIRVNVDGSLAEGDDLEAIGVLPLQSRKTDKDGFALFTWTGDQVNPAPDTSRNQLLAATMNVDLTGNKQVNLAEVRCVLGVPTSGCQPDANTACFGRGRFAAQVLEPFADGVRRAQVSSSSASEALFFHPGTNIDIPITYKNECRGSTRAFVFGHPSSRQSPLVLWILDTQTGAIRRITIDRFPRAIRACP
jgi:hypothetical protein